VEMALKIFSLGFGAYWMEDQNKFDFVITWIICKSVGNFAFHLL
jgi:two pore calcium channel protein, plant